MAEKCTKYIINKVSLERNRVQLFKKTSVFIFLNQLFFLSWCIEVQFIFLTVFIITLFKKFFLLGRFSLMNLTIVYSFATTITSKIFLSSQKPPPQKKKSPQAPLLSFLSCCPLVVPDLVSVPRVSPSPECLISGFTQYVTSV